MKRICDELRLSADFILIDSPAGIERGFRNAIAPADRVLVITNPEVSAVRDADRAIGILEAEEKHSPSLVINRLNPNLVKQHDMLSAEDVLDLLGIQLIGIVPEDEGVIVGSNRGVPSRKTRRIAPDRRSVILRTASRAKKCRSWISINKADCGIESRR